MPNPDLGELLDTLIPFAQQMLAKHGEFIPFGATVDPNGTVTPTMGDIGEQRPDSNHVIDFLTKAFRAQAAAGAIRAAAICYDVRITPPGQSEKTDAIAVSLEHRDGESFQAYVPYRKPRFFGKPRYAELFVTEGESTIFAKA